MQVVRTLVAVVFGVSSALVAGGAVRAAGSAEAQALLAPLEAEGSITYYIGDGTPGSAFRPDDRELAVWALEAWARASGGALRFEPAPEDQAMIHVTWVPAADGRYGEMLPLTTAGGVRGAAVFIRPDTEGLGPDIAQLARQDPLLRETIVYLTCLHELGHALGLSHTAAYADIMYFFGYGGDVPAFFARYRTRLSTRDDIPTVSGLSADDIARVRALYP